MTTNNNTPITALTSSHRESNMEMLRIVTMLLVMIVHADFRALGCPSVADFDNDTFRTVMRFVVESLSIICVNTFVLLSGWFGIRFRFERLFEFLFQIFFFLLIGLGIAILTVPEQAISIRGAANLLLLGEWDYWFVKCYLLMYIFAPLMNSFVEHSTEKQFRIFLILFYSFQSVYGLVGGAEWFRHGYSGLSFMGLYLLARYVRLYPNKLTTLNKSWDILIYFALSALMTLISVVVLKICPTPEKHIGRIYAYTFPLVIIASIYFLLFFSKIKLNYNKFINWIAASCFAIYLVHSNTWLGNTYYDSSIRYFFASFHGLAFLVRVILFITAVFVGSILIDKIRILLWKKILPLFSTFKTNSIVFFH